MLGKLKLRHVIPERPITVISVCISLILFLVFTYAARDIFLTARKKDESASRAALSAELSDFRMATRTENNESLFDDPAQFSSSNRPLRISTLGKPFFTYLLHTGNARSIAADTLEWEAPEACVTRFPPQQASPRGSSYGFEGCLAVLRSDPAGRYLYFSLRYPSDTLVRHRRGQKPTSADFIRLDFQGPHPASLYLVFETPVLAEKRYPSQIARFTGIHEVTGYGADGNLIRSVNAQAYERYQTVDGEERKYVTVLGRVDAARAGIPVADAWPSSEISQVKAGVVIGHPPNPGEPPSEIFNLRADSTGVARISVEKAYRENVRSHSEVNVFRSGALIWSSKDLPSRSPNHQIGIFQVVSDWWAQHVISRMTGGESPMARVEQKFGPDGQITATIQGTPYKADDIAARAFLWFSLGILLIAILGLLWVTAILRLRRIGIAAAEMAFFPSLETNLKSYAARKDEVGKLARIIDVLVKRTRSRQRRMFHKNLLAVQRLEEQNKLRQSILESIGHEIKSPLQALLSLNVDHPQVSGKLEQMNRAVRALYYATSVEAGLQNGTLSVETEDVSEYIAAFAKNKTAQGIPVRYDGPLTGVFARYDPIALDQVLEHIVDNGERFRAPSTDIKISLTVTDGFVYIAISNQGSRIEGDPSSIFLFGNTTAEPGSRNRGQGLFVAWVQMHGMGGSISASNVVDGVQLLLKLTYVARFVS